MESRRLLAAVGALFAAFAVVAVCMLQPPSTDPADLTVVDLALPKPRPAGSASTSTDAYPSLSPREHQAFQVRVAEWVGVANGACGTRVEPHCYQGACVALAGKGPSSQVMRFWRRPQLLVESLMPFEASRCGVAVAQMAEHQPFIGRESGGRCQGWVASVEDRDAAQALCDALVAQGPGI